MLRSKNIQVQKVGELYKIKLDESYLKSPAGKTVVFNHKHIAKQAVQDIYYLREYKQLKDYSILKLVFTLLDRVETVKKEELISKICSNMQADSILYWSDDDSINKLQQKNLQHIINLVNSKLNINLQPTYGLSLVGNIESTHLTKYLQLLSNNKLWVFDAMSYLIESVGITYLVFNSFIGKEDAFNSAFLHDFYNLKKWGQDKLKQQELDNKKQMFENLVNFINEC